MRFRISRALTDRPVVEGGERIFLNRQLIPLIRELLRVLTGEPTSFEWNDGAADLDISAGRDFAASSTLTQNTTLTLSNGFDGAEGTIWVAQDSVGGWLMTVVADGWTVLREAPFIDDDPGAAPNELTQYHYTFMTVAGAKYVVLERTYLL